MVHGLVLLACTAAARPEPPSDHSRLEGLLAGERGARREAARALLAAPDLGLVAGLTDALFYIPKPQRDEALAVLRAYTGEDAGRDYYAWVELVGRRADLAPGAGYLEWKRRLLAHIDPGYRQILYPGVPARIRLEEIVWGGVRIDEIASLDLPPHVPAAQAALSDDEKVFGLELGGAQRAYPLRYLSWHEMVNDVLGGEPFVLSL
jgi:hypothetical protein